MLWRGFGSTLDLLRQIEGVDGRVTKGVRVRWAGRLGASLSTAVFAYVLQYGWSWLLLGPAAGLVLSAALVSQGREWMRAAKQPFRYTYSVDPFEPISAPQDRRLAAAVNWIQADLILMLSQRIGRLALLPQDQVEPDTPEQPASHIHISGSYGSRYQAGGEVTIELMPRVRVGSARCSSTVAPAVRVNEAELPDLIRNRMAYDHVLERVYFSIATQIYRQIKGDIHRKIARLPTTYLRATAYFHEAEDYALSNTVDAFNDAGELYDEALRLYDRTRESLPDPAWRRRPIRASRRTVSPTWRSTARTLALVCPRFGHRELQIGKAKTGYAKALLFRNILANLSGREQKRVFDARRYVKDAISGLRKIPDGVTGAQEALFEAHLVAALAEHWSGDTHEAELQLQAARDSRRSDADGRALLPFVQAAVEPRLQRKIRLLRRAVELDPRFEIAHFELAFNQEQLWRSSDRLERTGSKLVQDAYVAVVNLSPANLTAWANLGYVRWLLWDPMHEDATDVVNPFDLGRRYKEIREEAFVAELDYGLARIAAEQGAIEQAYEHYISASAATMAQDATRGYVDYCFDRANDWLLHRYKRYLANVRRHLWQEAKKANGLPERIRDAVEAFALTDWANACAAYYRRSGEDAYRKEAIEAFDAAVAKNPRYVLARQSRAVLNLWIDREDETAPGDVARARKDIEAALEHEPRWLPALLEHARVWLALATHSEDQRETYVKRAKDAFDKIEGALPTVLPAELLDSDQIAKIEDASRRSSKRRNDELLDLVTDPAAGALALYVRVQTLGEAAEAGSERLCRYLQEHLRPADLDLLERLRKGADETAKQARRVLRTIVETSVENDPANRYWLNKLVAAEEVSPYKRRQLLRSAARWPGASVATLDWVSERLGKLAPNDDAIDHARQRARDKQAELEEHARTHLGDLVREHLEDGNFEDQTLVARLEERVAEYLDEPSTYKAELLQDVRGSALPVAYVLARPCLPKEVQERRWRVDDDKARQRRRKEDRAREILFFVAEEGGDDDAAVALRALAHLSSSDGTEFKTRLSTILGSHPSIARPLVGWCYDHGKEDLAEELKQLAWRTGARARTRKPA